MASNATATLTVKLRDLASPKFKSLGAAAGRSASRIGKLGSEFKRLEIGKRLGRDFGQLNRNLGGVASMAGRAGLAVGGLGAVAAGTFAKGVVDATAEMEMMQVALVTLEGSSGKAKEAMKWISDFSDRTPFELKEVNDAYTKLRVFGIEPTTGLLRILGDTAAAQGKPIMQSVDAVTKAMNGENEMLKEFGITASVAGKKVSFSWVEAGKTITKTVDRTNKQLVADTLSTIWNDQYAGAMDRMSKTWTGLMSTLRSKWFLFKVAVGESGLLDKLKERLVALLKQITKWTEDGTLERWAKQIGDAYAQAFDAVVDGFDWLRKNWPEIKNQLKESWRVARDLWPVLKSVAKQIWSLGQAASDAVGGPKNLLKILLALGAAKTLAPLAGIARTFGSIALKVTEAATGVKALTLQMSGLKVLAAGAAGWAFGSLLDQWIGKVLKLRGELLSTELALQGGESSGFNKLMADVGDAIGSETLSDAARGNMRRNLVDAQVRGDRAQAQRSAAAMALTGTSAQEIRQALDVTVRVDQDGRLRRTEVRGTDGLNLGRVAP